MAAMKQTLDYVLILWAVILGAAMWSTGAAVRQRRRPTAVAPEIFLPAIGLSGDTTVADLPARLASLAKPELPAYADQVVVVVQDRKSTRLNSSHVAISYAVFCLKKKTT